MGNNQIQALYDTLFRFESGARPMPYPIHKPLAFEDADISDINDWLYSHIPLKHGLSCLDAGCGVGYSSFYFNKMLKWTCFGISQSHLEVEAAQTYALKEGLSEQCTFAVRDFTLPFGQYFDVILAIESLKHASRISSAVANLAHHLHDGGLLIVVEDVWTNAGSENRYARIFREAWSVPELYTHDHYIETFEAHGFDEIERFDLTRHVQLKTKTSLRLKSFLLGACRSLSFGNTRRNLDLYLGSLMMDILYADGMFDYTVFVLKKS